MKRLFALICLLTLAVGMLQAQEEEQRLDEIGLTAKLGNSYNQVVGFNFSGTPGEKFIIHWEGDRDTVLAETTDEIEVSHVVEIPTSTQLGIRIIAMNPTGHILSLNIDSTYKYRFVSFKSPEITTIRCSHNELEALYFYYCSSVKILDCSYNRLSSLSLVSLINLEEKAVSLTHLDCSHNNIDNLSYLSDNKALVSLHCENNQIVDLRARAIPTLREVYCQNNQIYVCELDSNPVLERLDCSNNDLPFSPSLDGCPNLAYLDISDNEYLETFSICDNLKLETINFSRNLGLRYVYIINSRLKSLDFINNPKLESLDLHNLPSLRYLSCRNTMLSDLSFFAYDSLLALKKVECSGNRSLKRLYLGNSYGLEELICTYNNSLEMMELPQGDNLKAVDCSNNNQLKHLSLLNQTALETVKCTDNPLLERLELTDCPFIDSLNFSNNTQLKELTINHTKLRSLDLSVAPNLAYLRLAWNDSLTALHIDHPKLNALYLHNLPSLRYLSCQNTLLPELSFSAYDSLPSLQVVECSGNPLLERVGLVDCPSLDSLDFSNNNALNYLYIYDAKLKSLDLSVAPNLEEIRCSGNDSLTMLKVDNPVLRILEGGHNRLESLLIDNAPALETLHCNHNRLTSLRLPPDAILESLCCDSNHFQLSVLTNLVKQVENTDFNFISPQFVSAILQVGQTLDLHEEMYLGNELPESQWVLWDSAGYRDIVHRDILEFDAGRFSFKKTGRYRIEMNHYGLLFSHNGNVYDAQIFYDVTVVDSVARPVFSEPSGAVKRHTPVSLSTSTPDACIYYTEDGNVPDSAAMLYTEPIYIDEAVTIKAIAIKDTLISRVATASYRIAKDTTDTTDNEHSVLGTQVRIYAQDKTIYIQEAIGEVEVFTSNGQCVYRGSATAIPVKRSGLYVVVAKGGRWKVAVR